MPLLSDRDFQQIANRIEEAFWLLDLQSQRYIYASPALERMWGRPLAELVRVDAWVESVHPDDRGRMAAMLESIVSGTNTYRVIRPDGTIRWIEARVFPIHDGDRLVRVAGMCVDVTDKRMLEEKLHQSQKMESLGMLAGGVAHDFNNVLAVVLTCAQMLGEALTTEHPQHELVDEIADAVRRASALTGQLLAFSRKQLVEPEVLDFNHHVKEVRRMMHRIVGQNVRIELSLEPELPPVRIDPGRLAQVLLNLAVNARDAMPAGGTLSISTRVVSGQIVLAVRDTGTGIADDHVARVFEPFFTTKSRGKGTGMGLSVVRGIIEQAGGRIAVESQLGVGTVFHITLPIAHEEVLVTRHRRVTLTTGTETLLVVDDDPFVRRVAAAALRSRGYTVLEANGGSAALRVLDKQPIALMLTDLMMPRMNGRELAEIAGAAHPALKVMFMTGCTEDHDMLDGYAAELVEKPFKIDGLARAVRRALTA